MGGPKWIWLLMAQKQSQQKPIDKKLEKLRKQQAQDRRNE